MVATKDTQEPLSTSAKVGARDVTLTLLSQKVSKRHYDASLGFLFDSALPASKTPFERSGAILPATILVQGFKDNEKNTPFTLSLDYNNPSKKKSERAIRITKIESYGEDSSLSSALLRDIALDHLLRECLRLIAIRVRFFPAGEWDLNNYPKARTESSTYWVKVTDTSIHSIPIFGADSKDAADWALALADKKKSAWKSEQLLEAVARLYKQAPKVKDRALWISQQLEKEGFLSTRGEPFSKMTVNSQIREARKQKLISPSNRKKQTK
jgi:hypothetical protein